MSTTMERPAPAPAYKVKLMRQTHTRTSPAPSVHFPTTLDEDDLGVPDTPTPRRMAQAQAYTQNMATIPLPRSTSMVLDARPRSREPPPRRTSQHGLTARNEVQAGSAPASARRQDIERLAFPSYDAAGRSDSSDRESSRDGHAQPRARYLSAAMPRSATSSDFARPRMQPLRDESSQAPRRTGRRDLEDTDDERYAPPAPKQPARPARRSFGSAGVMEAEVARARDREAQAGRAITNQPVVRLNDRRPGRGRGFEPDDGKDTLEVQIVILGMEGAGKTAVAKRYTERAFYADADSPASRTLSSRSSLSAIGGNEGAKLSRENSRTRRTQVYTRKVKEDHDVGVDVAMQIWVVKEQHRSLSKLYYRESHAALILYDITSARSFAEVEAWLREIEGLDMLIYVVGTKADLAREGQRAIERRYAREQVYRWMTGGTGPPPAPREEPPRSAPASAPSSAFQPLTDNHKHPASTPSLTRSRTIDSPMSVKTTASTATSATSRPTPYRFMSLMPSAQHPHFGEAASPSSAVSPIESGKHIRSRAESMSATTALKRVSLLGTEGITTSASVPRLAEYLFDDSAEIKAARRKSADWSLVGRSAYLEAGPRPGTSRQSSTYTDLDSEFPTVRGQPGRRSLEVMSRTERELPEDTTTRGEAEVWGRCIRIGEKQEIRIGEVSAKANHGITELFQSITYQLALRKRRIAMAEARRARESIYLTDPDAEQDGKSGRKGDGRFSKGNCC